MGAQVDVGDVTGHCGEHPGPGTAVLRSGGRRPLQDTGGCAGRGGLRPAAGGGAAAGTGGQEGEGGRTFRTADEASGGAPRQGEGGGGEAPSAPRRPPLQFTPPDSTHQDCQSRIPVFQSPCPLCPLAHRPRQPLWSLRTPWTSPLHGSHLDKEIGRASCRERV